MSINKFLKHFTVLYVILHMVAIVVTFNVVLFGGLNLIVNYVYEPTNLHIAFVFFLACWCSWHIQSVVRYFVKNIIDKLSQ